MTELCERPPYPEVYRTRSIVDQVETLLASSRAFTKLDARWILGEGQDWYDSLDCPDWVEGPLVYIRHPSFAGGYTGVLEELLRILPHRRRLGSRGQYSGFYVPKDLRHLVRRIQPSPKTARMELEMAARYPGDFLIVPSQAGKRWAQKPIETVRRRLDRQEFGLGALAECCRLLTHPERISGTRGGLPFRLSLQDGLNMNCPGDIWRYEEFGWGYREWVSKHPCLRIGTSGKVNLLPERNESDDPRDFFRNGPSTGWLPPA